MNITKDSSLDPDEAKGKKRTVLVLIAILVIFIICGLIGLLVKCSPDKPVAGEPCLVVPVIDASSSELDAFQKNKPADYDALLKEGNDIDPCLLSGRSDPSKLDRDDDLIGEGFQNPRHVAVVVAAAAQLDGAPTNTPQNIAQRAMAWVQGKTAWYALQVAGDDRFVLWGKTLEQRTPRPKNAKVFKPKATTLSKITKEAPKSAPVAPRAAGVPVQQPAAPTPAQPSTSASPSKPAPAPNPPASQSGTPAPGGSAPAQPSKPADPKANTGNPAPPKANTKPAKPAS